MMYHHIDSFSLLIICFSGLQSCDRLCFFSSIVFRFFFHRNNWIHSTPCWSCELLAWIAIISLHFAMSKIARLLYHTSGLLRSSFVLSVLIRIEGMLWASSPTREQYGSTEVQGQCRNTMWDWNTINLLQLWAGLRFFLVVLISFGQHTEGQVHSIIHQGHTSLYVNSMLKRAHRQVDSLHLPG